MKWTSISTTTKCSKIFASTNVEKFSASVVFRMVNLVHQTTPNYNLFVAGASGDAANPNWTAFIASSTHSPADVLPNHLLQQFPNIFFGMKHIMVSPTNDRPFVFIPDNMHLSKNVVTALEKSSSKRSKRNIKYKKCPMNLGMIEKAWRATGGGTNQLQPTKLRDSCFLKDAKSRMDCPTALVVVSGSTSRMMRAAIDDDTVDLGFNNKNVYIPLIYFCDKWNDIVDITNGRDGNYYTPQNGNAMQMKLLNILDWFSKWKKNHDDAVVSGDKTEFNFFADATWKCIQMLILSHVVMIELYCIKRK